MASGKPRSTRILRNWMIEQVESGQFLGVCWDDTAKTMFRIPWKHAGKQDFREDQDAAIFKAWAMFKKKDKEGDLGNPAIWKTRLRCALNKSCEFEEVPERGRMDVAEPYKVYRILPAGTLPAQPRIQKSTSKRYISSVSPEREEAKEKERTAGVAHLSDSGCSSSSSSSSSGGGDSSPEPEGAGAAAGSTEEDPVFMEHLLPLNSDYSLLLTFIYGGRVVGETRVSSLDCRLVAETSESETGMVQVPFPKAEPQEPTHRLLSQLERGVMVASNSRGLFVQRLCPIPISWNAPEAPPGPGPHLLPSNKCVELFKTTCFSKDLIRYFQGQGPRPKYQATLHFWEEMPGSSHTQNNLITVQESEIPLLGFPLAVLVQSLGEHAPGPAGGRLDLEQSPKVDDDDGCVLGDQEGLLTRTQSSLKTCIFVPARLPLELRISGQTANPEGKFHVLRPQVMCRPTQVWPNEGCPAPASPFAWLSNELGFLHPHPPCPLSQFLFFNGAGNLASQRIRIEIQTGLVLSVKPREKMFYYPNVLQRHTGCFSTIWLAATRGSRLVKREYMKVNVVKTCEEILNYVLVRVQPPMPGLPRPRFSLYLSAQLQIGVIRVYCQQCQYLVEDIQHILEHLHRVQQRIRIDMEETDLPNLLLPNCLAMMETLEDAPEPFFGMMSVDAKLPSPFDIPQIRHLLEAVTPEKGDKTLVTQQSPETITLQEAEPIRMLPIEGEQDLPEASRGDLDLLIAEEDDAILLEERQQRRLLRRRRASPALDEPKEEPRAMEGDGVVPPLSPPAPAQVEGIREPLPGQDFPPEVPKLTGWEPRALLTEVTPPQELRLPAPPSAEKLPSLPSQPDRRRRRRQLLFWDKETQISREKFEEQLQTGVHCWEYPAVQPPKRMITSPGELFRSPTLSGWLAPELLALWTHCAQIPPRMLRPRPQLELEAAAEERGAADEELRRKTEVSSEIEVLREAQEPSGPLMLSAELSLEAAEEEKSHTSLIPPEERWAWIEEGQPEPPALPMLPELPEVPMEMPPEPELLSSEAVFRAVAQELQANREPDFSSLVPPLSPRKLASRVFYLLLVLCAQKILQVEQEKPYGRLLIHLGPRFQ
ncbi:meiotic recombination protein REC8-like [Sigmodon hispidus]